MQTTVIVLLCAIAFINLSTCSATTQTAQAAAVVSHSVASSSNSNTLKGKMVVSNSDKTALTQSKDALSSQLTQQVQSNTQNKDAKVQVNQIEEANDGSGALIMTYECHNVADQDTAKNTLNNAVQQPAVKETIVKTSKTNTSSTTTTKPQITTKQSTTTSKSQY